jgi:hypothetical protein
VGDLYVSLYAAARTSETLVNVYQTTQRYKPEDSHLRTHRRENLKSYLTKYGHIGVHPSVVLHDLTQSI